MCDLFTKGKEIYFSNIEIGFLCFSKSKLDKYEAFKTSLRHFFMNFILELVFPINSCPDMEVLNWLSEFVTFRKTTDFHLFPKDVRQDTSSELCIVDKVLLKRYFYCQENESVRKHLEEKFRSLHEQCKTTEAELSLMNAILCCYKVCMTLTYYNCRRYYDGSSLKLDQTS